MPRKTYRPEEIIVKLREAEVLLAQGMKVCQVKRRPSSSLLASTAGMATDGSPRYCITQVGE